jgi:hypothetical protein
VDENHQCPAEMTTSEFQQGSWGQAYQHADVNRLQALELLFRCNIIPVEAFPDCEVSQEHIEECIWIANHMLRRKPLEEWISNEREGRRAFDESVVACFAARSGVKTPRSFETGYANCHSSHSQSQGASSLRPPPLQVERLYSEKGIMDCRGNPFATRQLSLPGSEVASEIAIMDASAVDWRGPSNFTTLREGHLSAHNASQVGCVDYPAMHSQIPVVSMTKPPMTSSPKQPLLSQGITNEITSHDSTHARLEAARHRISLSVDVSRSALLNSQVRQTIDLEAARDSGGGPIKHVRPQ